MVFASNIEGAPLTGAGDAPLGVVTNVLYHPSEPRAIGAAVRPTALLYVVDRPGTYLPLSALTFRAGGSSCDLVKLPSTRRGGELLGFDPDLTVIWTGMNVLGPRGEKVGWVSDVGFDEATGSITRLDVGAGVVGDVAHGRYLVPGVAVLGFRDGAVMIDAEVSELEGSGGLAKAAAEGAVAAAAVAHAAGEAVIEASGAAGRTIKAVAESEVPRKAARAVRRTWRDTVKGFREGMKDDK
jgi:sporulation protein YlmC with PRC-barrel domain